MTAHQSLILPVDGATMDPWRSRFQASAWGVAFDVPVISRIVGNLYVGGSVPGMPLPPEFHHVVACHQPGYEIDPRLAVTVTVTPHTFGDSDHDPDPVLIDRLAREVAEKVKGGAVLVHCQMGINRSSLVAACAMVLDGYSPEQATHLIRRARPGALSNKRFVRFLQSYRPAPVVASWIERSEQDVRRSVEAMGPEVADAARRSHRSDGLPRGI